MHRAGWRTAFVAVVAACAVMWSCLAEGVITSSDDRDNATPTGWWWYYNVTETDINNFVAANNARPVDIQMQLPLSNPRRFSVAFVSNAGAYAKGWWWYYDVTPAALASLLGTNNARLVSLKAYDIGGGDLRFTAVMIPNTGADQKGWWWYYNLTGADIATFVAANSARLTQIDSYVIGGVTRYAVVMISNTGADQKGWYWYYNMPAGNIPTFLAANQGRLIDMDRDPSTGNYNIIMTDCTSNCPAWWWYYGMTAQQVTDAVAQNGARIIDINSYPGCGSLCFSFVLINNSTDIATRVGEMLRNGTDGTKGLYLKEVGGPVLANLEETWAFEPASTMKAVHHVYAMRRVQLGTSHLSDSIVKYQPPASGSCPGNTIIGTESLQVADAEMMRHSDNTRTREIADTYGNANIQAYAQSFGMTSTQLNHVLGCGGPTPNQTTLTDLATLYEGVANGTLLNATNRATFYNQMPGKAQFLVEGYDWTHLWDTDIPNMINAEAPVGMRAAVKQNFQTYMDLAYKAGNYKLCGATCATYVDHIAIAGWFRIPYCSGASIAPKEYVFGIFLNNSTSDTTSANTFNATKSELLREQIRAGLQSCTIASKSLDVDGNTAADALTDGLMLVRYLFGVTGSPLTNSAIGANATRSTPAATQQYMDAMRLVLDVDGNGQADALTDGIMFIRYLFGVRGTALINNAIGAGATRTTAAQIEPFLQSLMP